MNRYRTAEWGHVAAVASMHVWYRMLNNMQMGPLWELLVRLHTEVADAGFLHALLTCTDSSRMGWGDHLVA
jgi:hypothetical protein